VGQPIVGLFLLVMMKIAIDLVVHRKEHLWLAASGRTTQGQSEFARK